VCAVLTQISAFSRRGCARGMSVAARQSAKPPQLRRGRERFGVLATTDGKKSKASGTPRDAYISYRPHPHLHPRPLAGEDTGGGAAARQARRARLSAFHHGACCGERTPQLSFSRALPGTGLGRSGCYPLPAAIQYSEALLADRSYCRPGALPKPPGSAADEACARGNRSRSAGSASPPGVLVSERD